MPGVLDILTYENVGALVKPAPGPDGKPSTSTLESAQVWHAGQIVAIVVAETYEAAREAAHKVQVSYVTQAPGATFDSPGVVTEPHKPEKGPDPQKGDAVGALAGAPVKSKLATRPPLNTTIPSNCSRPRVRGKVRSSLFTTLPNSCGAPRPRPPRGWYRA